MTTITSLDIPTEDELLGTSNHGKYFKQLDKTDLLLD